MKKILGLLFALSLTMPAWATDYAHENVAVVDGGAVVSSGNPLHVTGSVSTTGITQAVGTNAAVQPKSFLSSTVLSTGVLGFTAAGSLLCSDIILETDATGLATGTSFTVTTNDAFGVAVVCSQLVAGLNGNKTVKCSGATVPMVPFVILDTETLTLKCVAGSCDGTGHIRVTPNCMRLTASAGMS